MAPVDYGSWIDIRLNSHVREMYSEFEKKGIDINKKINPNDLNLSQQSQGRLYADSIILKLVLMDTLRIAVRDTWHCPDLEELRSAYKAIYKMTEVLNGSKYYKDAKNRLKQVDKFIKKNPELSDIVEDMELAA